MINYAQLSAEQAQQCLPELCWVLQGCVAQGASVGFTDAADSTTFQHFWQSKVSSLASGESMLWLARREGRVVGTVMLNFSTMPNGRHRAEISKLLVHPQARRLGIARELMKLAEQQAQACGKSLLVLDTRRGDVATDLYLSLGWQIAGNIPFYAESVTGELEATTYMFKLLPSPAA